MYAMPTDTIRPASPNVSRKPRRRAYRLALLAALAVAAVSTTSVRGDDWPQFNGPEREGRLPESIDLNAIADNGLKKLWSAPVDGGYSGPAVADGKVVVTDFVKQTGQVLNNAGARDDLTGLERVSCFDAASGELLWRHEDPRQISVSFGIGPRATPTIDAAAGTVYTLGSEGHLLALSLKDGSLLWRRSLVDDFDGSTPQWGFAASPLVFGDLLYTLASPSAVVAALDKQSGETKWTAIDSSGIGYCPPTIIEHAGEPTLLIWDPENLTALEPESGKVLWSTPLKPSYEMSIAPPLQNDDMLYVSGIGETAAMYRLKSDRTAGVETLWTGGDPKRAVYCSNAAGVFTDGLIAGADNGTGSFIAIDPADGERLWQTFELTTGGERRASHGTAFVFKGSGDLYGIFTETGDFVVVRLTREGHEELSREHVVDATNSWQGRNVVWSYPAFADGKLYFRNDRELACYAAK